MIQTKKQGKQKRYGRNKVKCARYYNEDRRTKSKLRKFKKNNIGKDWVETKIKKAVSDFMDMQYERQKNHKLTA